MLDVSNGDGRAVALLCLGLEASDDGSELGGVEFFVVLLKKVRDIGRLGERSEWRKRAGERGRAERRSDDLQGLTASEFGLSHVGAPRPAGNGRAGPAWA